MGIELAEADTIVFIGYSLRPEDFNFRYMLAKHVQGNTKLRIFDFEPDAAKRGDARLRLIERFGSFFQKNKDIDVNVDGWENGITAIASLLP